MNTAISACIYSLKYDGIDVKKVYPLRLFANNLPGSYL